MNVVPQPTLLPVDWWALGAVIALSVGSILLLLLEFIPPRPNGDRGPLLSMLALIVAGYAAYSVRDAKRALFEGMFVHDGLTVFFTLLFCAIGAVAVLMSWNYAKRTRIGQPEYYALLLTAIMGMVVMAASNDLITIFLGLELMSLSLYVMVGFRRHQLESNEAALKYFLLGAFASGFLLYGIALTYGATGETNLVLAGRVLAGMPASTLAQVGLGMLLIGFGFKVAAVPFHMWAPDVYDGAPTPVTGFMATGVKTAGFIALVRVLNDGFPSLTDLWQPALAVLAILSIVVGNVVALAQTSMKRLLAYSSISHAGYLLVAVWAASPAGHMAVLLYLWAYSLTSLAAFGMVAAVEHVGARTVRIEDLEGLFRTRPWGALSMSVCLLSLLGFPGTFGFIGKWLIMTATLEHGQVVLPVLVGLGSLVSLGYYLPVIMAMTMKPERTPDVHRQVLVSKAGKVIIAGAVAAIIFLGIWPRIPLDLGRRTVESMTKPAVVAAEQP